METKTPAAAGSRDLGTLGGIFQTPFTLANYRAQVIASRFAVPLEAAAIVAALAFAGGAHHG